MWRQQLGAQREAQPGGTQPGAVLPTTGSGGEPAVTLKALGGLALTRKIHEAAAWHEANRQHKRLQPGRAAHARPFAPTLREGGSPLAEAAVVRVDDAFLDDVCAALLL